MGDTFHAIIVGECLPKTFGDKAVSEMGYVRAFEGGVADADAIMTHLALSRSQLSRTVWLRNMTLKPGGYQADRPGAVAKWRQDLEGPDTSGLLRATKRDMRILCTTNWVSEDVSRAHGFAEAVPCISKGSTTVVMPGGGTWQFATWFRTDIRPGTHAGLVRDFLMLPKTSGRPAKRARRPGKASNG